MNDMRQEYLQWMRKKIDDPSYSFEQILKLIIDFLIEDSAESNDGSV